MDSGCRAVVGGLDYCLKNKFGLGEEFENGIKTLVGISALRF